MKLPKFIKGNRITLLHNGAEYFPALESAIDEANKEIHLQTYIFKYDLTGIRIASALKRAAQRGVAVHLLIDGFGSLSFPQKAIDNLIATGVQVMHYRKEVFSFRFRRHRLRRMHRKLVVIDARIAFVGGINIINDYQKPGEPIPRFDYAVKIEGPLLATIHSSARRLWMLVAWAHFKKRWITHLELQPITKPVGNQRAAFVIRDNLRHRRDIERSYLKAIATAYNEIIIANAYFLPGRNFRQALIHAARRGVSVILLLQGKIEYRIQYHASRALYDNLLDAGIKIYEYRKSFLHAKVAVIDQYWSTVGSSNIDPLSLLMAQEANVMILDQAFAMELRTTLQIAMRDAKPVSKLYWGKQSWINRSLNWISYYIVRILQGVLGYSQESTRV
ncbi:MULTISPECIES: cardiolipin synthase ClsB [Nitrosomonas]|uniref:Cardiolipin synthase B n=1 Tax=Nitrosomonas communis TaxID=44574 RepID=A0A0F7KFP2_9PROT|nr:MULTISPECIES: cardiolipin synthase ClsB [Nitrosomonas]AKH37958.1 phospholipase [Nitrosomonas communis]TYP85015.1 cardiolipin synthase [Nitrosomonas communis]UVS63334.1 cardiolipin synthase ClsB [Nitrosomonas sp. PLL12]